jgi:aminopeptidase N
MRRSIAFKASLVPLVVALGMLAAAVPAGAAGGGSPGAEGVGDNLYPQLGNGGFDAQHYDLALRYDRLPSSSSTLVTMTATGSITMTARATQALSRFDLDYSGDKKNLGALTVNGAPARWVQSGEDLLITPAQPIARGATFTVVSAFTATSNAPDGSVASGTAFFGTAEGTATAGQPDGMHHMFPSSDHPSDKATFTFRLDVPSADTAVANGTLVSKKAAGPRTTWTYDERDPMATELTQIAVGAFTVVPRGAVGGAAVRDVVPTKLLAEYRTKLDVERRQLAWMTARVGPYPFPLYGSLVVQQPDLGFALETQTISIFDTTWFDLPEGVWSPTMTHELAHQWFGDSVAPQVWSNIWQNEGHATWYEVTWAEENHQLIDDYGYDTVDELMRAIYAGGDQDRHDHGAVARPLSGSVDDLFSSQSYEGGALVLYALRQKVGADTFAKIERTWAQVPRGRSVGTEAFIATAALVARRADVAPFLHAWLYDLKTPPMPGHPDWTVDPVGSSTLQAATFAKTRNAHHRR